MRAVTGGRLKSLQGGDRLRREHVGAAAASVADVLPVGGWLIRLTRNSSVRTRPTIVLTTARGIELFCTACSRVVPKYWLNGCS